MSFVRREYQEIALQKVTEEIYSGRRTLLVLPTGTGKTYVFSRLVRRWLRDRGSAVLVVAHRRELIRQAREKIIQVAGLSPYEVGVELGRQKSGELNQVVVGSVQTLKPRRLRRLNPSRFGLVIVDEAHHAVAKTYAGVFRHFGYDVPPLGEPRDKLDPKGLRLRQGECGLLGVTATPDRLDGRALGKWFDTNAFTYDIRDAIDDGWLVRIRPRMIFSENLDLSRVKTTAGDLNRLQLAGVMERNSNLDLVAKATFDESGDRPTLIFAASLSQAEGIARRLNELKPGCADWIDGKASTGRRDQVLERHERGDFQFLCNMGLYTEGVDLPYVSCIVIARPTKSRSLYSQMIGRGTRLLGASYRESVEAGKKDVLVLDFCGVSGRHRLVCAVDVLDGCTDEKVRKIAIKRLMRQAEDLQGCLDAAAAAVVEESRAKAMSSVRYRSVAADDPFAVLGVRPRSGRYGGRPATPRQREILERHRIPGWSSLDFGQAREIIRAIEDRRQRGVATVRQARALLRRGLNPDCPQAVARWAMDQLAKNRWKMTPEIANHPGLQMSGESQSAGGERAPGVARMGEAGDVGLHRKDERRRFKA